MVKIGKDRCEEAFSDYLTTFSKKFKNKKILDIGCGNGDHTEIFSKISHKTYGLDTVDIRFREYKNKFKFIKYGGKKMPFKENSFDLIVCLDVIEHIKKDSTFIEEMYRILRKNGTILIATPNRNRLSNLILKLIGRPITYPYLMGTDGRLGKMIHIREYLKDELFDLFKKAQFKKIEIHSLWFGLRGFINLGIKTFITDKFNLILILTAKK